MSFGVKMLRAFKAKDAIAGQAWRKRTTRNAGTRRLT
jgi:hypothetical protein